MPDQARRLALMLDAYGPDRHGFVESCAPGCCLCTTPRESGGASKEGQGWAQAWEDGIRDGSRAFVMPRRTHNRGPRRSPPDGRTLLRPGLRWSMPKASGELTIRPLTAETWEAFADLAERHNGVWGGCWCTWFHTFEAEKTHTVEGNRALKEQLVREGRAHAALVFDGEVAVGWCEYGTPEELPNINHRKEYEKGVEQLTRLPAHLLLHRQELSTAGRLRTRAAGRLGPHRAGRWRARRGVPAGHGRQEDHGVVPLQRHPQPLRADRLHLPAPQGQEPLRDEPAGRPPRKLSPERSVRTRRPEGRSDP